MTPGERILLWVAGMLAVMLALNEGERCVRKWWRKNKARRAGVRKTR